MSNLVVSLKSHREGDNGSFAASHIMGQKAESSVSEKFELTIRNESDTSQ
jgi:hypothetical protein